MDYFELECAVEQWAEEKGIILDRRKTKAHMIAELNKQLQEKFTWEVLLTK